MEGVNGFVTKVHNPYYYETWDNNWCHQTSQNMCDVIYWRPFYLSFQEMEYNSNSSSYVDQLFSSDEAKCQNAVM